MNTVLIPAVVEVFLNKMPDYRYIFRPAECAYQG